MADFENPRWNARRHRKAEIGRDPDVRIASTLQPIAYFRRIVGKLFATLVLAPALAVLANPTVFTRGWTDFLARQTGWRLAMTLFCVPVAWLVVQFAAAFFGAMSRLAQEGGASAAGVVAQAPRVFLDVSRRGWRRAQSMLAQWNFQRRYLRRLHEDYGLFNDRSLGLINPKRLDLEKVYVDLQISNQIAQPRGDLLQKPVTGRESIWNFLGLIRPGSGLVLLGAPGSGKTTLLQYMLLVFATRRHRQHQQSAALPIFVELRALRELFESQDEKRQSPTLAAAIRFCWKKNSRIGDLMSEEPPRWLEHQLRKRNVLLLLDGLDEVAQVVRPLLSRWVQSQMRNELNRRCKFVLTSRPAGYLSAPIEDQTVLEIQPFTKEQIDKFINSWYLANELVSSERRRDDAPIRRHAAKEATDLRNRLRENQNLQDLAVNPLLLTMLCMVHRYHGALPGSRSQLYDEICQVLLERWRQGKGMGDELHGEQKLSILRPLAHEYMVKQTREMAEDDVASVISEQLELVGYMRDRDVQGPVRFIRSIQMNSGLLLEKEVGLWSFAHKTFQEYLTSEYWLRCREAMPALDSMVTEDWWRESLLLYATRADASELVAACLDAGSHASWALAFQCLTEAHSLRPEVRARAEADLKTALRSPEITVFTPAARSMHYLRQLQVRLISDGREQRVSLVTQAEYQLFLNGLKGPERRLMTPPHWRGERFVGSPESPVLGVWHWQAKAYASCASRGPYSDPWKLPDTSDQLILDHTECLCWCEGGELSHGNTPLGGSAWDLSDERNCLPGGLHREFELNLKCITQVGSAIAEAYEFARGQYVDISAALAHSLNVVFARTFGREATRAHELAHISSFDLRFVDELSRALAKQWSSNAPLILMGSVGHTRRQAAVLSTRWFRKERRRTVVTDVAHQGEEAAGLSRRRAELKEALRALVDAGGRWTPDARLWRQYGIAVLKAAEPHLSPTLKTLASNLQYTFALVNNREVGTVRPVEAIQLVRDRKGI